MGKNSSLLSWACLGRGWLWALKYGGIDAICLLKLRHKSHAVAALSPSLGTLIVSQSRCHINSLDHHSGKTTWKCFGCQLSSRQQPESSSRHVSEAFFDILLSWAFTWVPSQTFYACKCHEKPQVETNQQKPSWISDPQNYDNIKWLKATKFWDNLL